MIEIIQECTKKDNEATNQ